MASVQEAAYLKAACFHVLSSTVYGLLLDTYGPATVMMFMNQQLPMNTSMALTVAPNIGSAVKANLLAVDNLAAVSFIKKNWNPAKSANSKDPSRERNDFLA